MSSVDKDKGPKTKRKHVITIVVVLNNKSWPYLKSMIYMSKQIPKQLLLLFFCFIRPLKSKVLIPCDIKGLWILLPFYFSLRKITEKVKTKSSRKNILQMKKIEREREREMERMFYSGQTRARTKCIVFFMNGRYVPRHGWGYQVQGAP